MRGPQGPRVIIAAGDSSPAFSFMPDDKYIGAPPEGFEGWREVWAEDRRYPPAGGLVRRLARRIHLLLRGASGEARRQREFNAVVLDLIGDLRGDLAAVREDFRVRAEEIIRDLRAVNDDLSRDISEVDGRVHKGVDRGDALIAAVDRKIEGLAARVRDAVNPVVASASASSTMRADFHYRRLEDALRGSEGEVREAARHYLRYAKEMAPVIDVGCGRGEFLALCHGEGISAVGFDSNERAVADLVAKGLAARVGLVPACFEGVADRTVGTIVAMHVVEHLPFPELYALLTESARVLKPGGYLAVETPNAGSIVASAREFWKDPTHLGPRHEAALVTLAREVGFDVAELGTSAPFPNEDRLQTPDGAGGDVATLVERLNELLYGDQNLRLVLRAR
jgi:2-polyprenyl-3-methyl-5-hydroxy-6-metoxy-1,4-benzoquinol methylase